VDTQARPRSSRSLRRRALVATFLAALGVAAALPASAGPIGFQASGGWYTEAEEFFLGAGARVGAGSITVIPNAEWLFVDSGSAYSLNVDGTLSVLPMGVATGYMGAGIGWFTFDPEQGDSNTDTVINLIAGASFNLTSLKPFGQFKWVVEDGDDPLVFSLGLRF
jgi:hypothetical protein